MPELNQATVSANLDNLQAQEYIAIQALADGDQEVSTRSLTEVAVREFVNGNLLGLLALPAHSCSLLPYNSHHVKLLAAFRRVKVPQWDRLKAARESSLLAQMNQWSEAARMLTDGSATRTPFQNFLLMKVMNAQELPAEHVSRRDYESMVRALGGSNEVRFDLLRNFLAKGDEKAFADGLKSLDIEPLVPEVCRLTLAKEAEYAASNSRPLELGRSPRLDAVGAKVLAVFGMRCTGGSAVQDWLDDFCGVASSAGEYLAVSGWYGIRSLLLNSGPGRHDGQTNPLLNFVQHHVCGLSIPLSRSFSRIRRQALDDRRSGLYVSNLEALRDSLRSNSDMYGFLTDWFASTWANYLSQRPEVEILLLRKLFSSGNFDLFHLLPPLRGIMVWRDPRDQYADQVQRGFVQEGDVDGFVSGLVSKVAQYRYHLDQCGALHRERMVDVSFERFVLDSVYRNELSSWIGLASDSYTERRFLPKESARNIGISKGRVDGAECREIEVRLRPLLQFSLGDVSKLDYEQLLRAADA